MAQQDSKDNFVIEALNQFTRLRGLAMTGDTAALHREIDAMADDDLRCMVYTLAAFRLEDEGGHGLRRPASCPDQRRRQLMADDRKLERTKTPGVYKRGDSYVCRWRHRGQSHKRYFATYGEAREFKRTLHGSGKQPTTKQTVLDYYEKWIDSYRGRTARGLEDTTRDEYRRSFRLHVLPFPLAREKLRDVTSRDVSDWFGDLEAKGVHPPSIRKAKAALSAMLATAAQAGDIAANPAVGVRYVPTNVQPKRQRRTLTVEDVCGLDGQGIAFHAFRKACGSMLLLRAGKSPKQVQGWLGHSQLTTTMNIYVTELDDGLGGADELDGLWGHHGATDHPQTAANGTDPEGEFPLSDAVSADSRNALD